MDFSMPHAPFTSMNTPYILDKTAGRERVWDLWSRLHSDRIVYLGDDITDYNANLVIGQLLQLEASDRAQPIQLYINSRGGSVSAGLAIYDVMNYIEPEVRTVCVGLAASMAAVLLACGAKGHRYCMPNSSVMIHQVRGGAQGVVTDMEITLKRAAMLKEKLNRLLAEKTGRPYEQVVADAERDYWLSSDEALEYGLVDKVLFTRVSEKKSDDEEE